jgi:hypothetical protein
MNGFTSEVNIRASEVYGEYMVPPNLQEHMLKVAAFAQVIKENWSGPEVDLDSVIQAGKFHDIAKPMTFNLTKQAKFGLSQQEITNLGKLQNRLKLKYGENEHDATVQICRDIGLNSKTVGLVDNLEWSYIPRLLEESDIEALVLIYCDMRIGPEGVLSIKDRHEDLQNREQAYKLEERIQDGLNLEEFISKNVTIDLNNVTDEQINSKLDSLLN